MRWIARFFMVIALAFLALDILDTGGSGPGAEAPATTGATDGAETGDGTLPQNDGNGAAPGTDATAATGPSRVVLYSLGERWFQYFPDNYQLISPAVSRHVSPWLDDNIVQPLMLKPAFLIFFALWMLFSFFSWLIGRSREDDW